ncbi:hypothetical protein BJY01DRAFT_143046 [Aspergillus pseudoustus]|uniref:Uncharacterized protein n=1 Tax=Aspergillus pseudoustus TaxID=1810923 RepID=A0ABR4IGL4_9EURO
MSVSFSVKSRCAWISSRTERKRESSTICVTVSTIRLILETKSRKSFSPTLAPSSLLSSRWLSPTPRNCSAMLSASGFPVRFVSAENLLQTEQRVRAVSPLTGDQLHIVVIGPCLVGLKLLTQKRHAVRDLADDYILCTDGSINVVVCLDIE